MSTGIIYVMTTIVEGLIKIGKTKNFTQRIYNLERNGYNNITGLKRVFAIEVEDYEEKEKLLHELFAKSNVENSELFAVDKDIVIQLLSAFEGTQIYPKQQSKTETFNQANQAWKEEESKQLEKKIDNLNKNNTKRIPDGHYYLKQTRKGYGTIEAELKVVNGELTLLKGSTIAPLGDNAPEYVSKARQHIKEHNNILIEDTPVKTPSEASSTCTGLSSNGNDVWKNSEGVPIKNLKK